MARPKMRTDLPQQDGLTTAAIVAAEDLACGDYISRLSEMVELPSFLWERGGADLPPHEPVRVRLIPDDAGRPLKIFAICLPFVYAKAWDGELATLDVRRAHIVRLDRRCAKSVWKALQSRARQSVGAADGC